MASGSARRAAVRLLWGVFLACGVLHRPTCHAQAASDLYIAEAKSALGGRYRPGSIVPIEVVVTNKGGPVLVQLVAHPKTSESRSSACKETNIGTGSFRHFLYVTVDVPGATTFRVAMYDSHGREIDKLDVEAPNLPEENLFIGFCGATRPVVAVPGETGVEASVVPIAPASIPDHWIGLSPLDVLIVNDLDANTISLAGQNSIRQWLARGGTLVLAGGGKYQYLNHAFYGEFLPVHIIDSMQVTELAGLAPLCGAWKGETPLIVCKTSRPRGTVLADENGMPLAVERRYGVGRVIFLAFDPSAPALRRWRPLATLWRALLGISIVNEDETPKECDPSAALTSFLRRGGSRLSFLWVALFIIAYVVVAGPVDYLVLRRMGRLTLTWITFPVYIVTFSVAGYALAYSAKGGDMLINKLSVMDVDPNAKQGYGTTYFSLFSPKNGAYTLPIAPGEFLHELTGTSGPGAQRMLFVTESVTLNEDPPQWDVETRMNIWSTKQFRAYWRRGDQAGVLALLKGARGRRLAGTLQNTTAYTITKAAILWGDRIYYLTGSRKKHRSIRSGGEVTLGERTKSSPVARILTNRAFQQQIPYYGYQGEQNAFDTLVAMTASALFRDVKIDPEARKESQNPNHYMWNEFVKGTKKIRIRRGQATSVASLGQYLRSGKAVLVAQIAEPLHDVTVEGWKHKDREIAFIRQILDVGAPGE
ncbi:MAG: hypothetical protein GXP25_24710 [Planctomycetes bacterium]|nr:hypothetical protein [Planctomycetota bacterium]